jgi:hypothetical protein
VAEAKLPKDVAAEAVPQPDEGLLSDKILPNPLPAIPAGWEEQHLLQQLKLAEQIAGRSVKGDEAAQIIRTGLERRLT